MLKLRLSIKPIYILSLTLFFSLQPFLFNKAVAQLIVTQSYTKTQLVKDILLGPGVVVSNIKYTGSDSAIGFFNAMAAPELGLDSGIILTSGDIYTAVGPNNSSGATGTSAGGGWGGPGDPILDSLSASTTYDAAILEFDFIPYADTIKFRYVFGSEEYLEFVGSYNDIFAFVISGVTTTLAPKNIALIPGTNTPVSINNVNDNVHSSYYFDNGDGFDTLTSGKNIQYDGFTTPLTAIYKVICGEKYHIKLAIADAGDGVLDSGVFLEAGSFSSAGATYSLTATTTKDTICPKENVVINCNGTFLPTSTFDWAFEDGATVLSGSGKGPYVVNWASEGLKKVKLTAHTNCLNVTDSIYVKIFDCSLKFPNVFSPNHDGKNDFLKFTNLQYFPNTRLIVYNRWGNKVYESSNYQNNWDGGNDPDGVYYYLIYPSDYPDPVTGSVYIFRD
jgi:gliding motility-associated-like protein